ncbi:MAG TPA: redoxin domain-containing protein [Ferruginibacter sp.]|nr:redoxin domain-containing protein [Ferruginibacter sp.]
MNKKLRCATFLCFICFNSWAQYKISVTCNYDTGMAYLTYHYGKNLNIEDSGKVNNKGAVVFQGNTPLQQGIYALVLPGKRFSLDFLVSDVQTITIDTDTTKLPEAKITGSKDNELFINYQKFVNEKGRLLMGEREAYMRSKTKADSALHEANYIKLNTEINKYREDIIQNNSNSLMASLFNAMKEAPYPTKVPVTRQDTLNNYYFYKQHYWDGITFMDDRIIRTPFFLPKLERYYREVMQQAPDSLIKDIDYRLLYARNAPEMYKFLLNWYTDEYINPKYMGQDKVFIHLFEKYHSKGLTAWLTDKQMEIITRRAYMQMANQLGEQASNLELLDTAGKPKPLYNLSSDYTVVIFWDPNCGHCKEEIPRLDSIYRASWKAKKVKIYAVLSEKEDQKNNWKKFIREHDITGWTNVYQSKKQADEELASNRPNFRQLYDVITTPTLYLLDKEKRIIGKKLTLLQMNDLLETKLKTAVQ